MSRPRPIISGTTYIVTRRTTQRQFLLKPTALTMQIFKYCVGLAALLTGVRVHAICVLSNHWHAVVTDVEGHIPAFARFVHKYVAKAVNASLGRFENLWSSERVSYVRLEDADAVMRKMAYTVLNPVSARLVRTRSKWPGVMGYLPEHTEVVMRPAVFFRENGSTPKSVELQFVPPPCAMNDVDAFYGELEEQLDSEEKRLRDEAGGDFLGVRTIMQQDVYDTPTSFDKRRGVSPRVATRNKWLRIEALQRLKAFVDHYRQAYLAWRAGDRDVEFPVGTYGLRVWAGVKCSTA